MDTLNSYLAKCFIDKDLYDDSSFKNININDDEYTREFVYSYVHVFGSETERDLEKRVKIAQDIKIAIKEYIAKNYTDYQVSAIELFDGRNYEIELTDDNAILYINGPEKEVDAIKMQLDSLVQHLYSCNLSKSSSSWSKFFWL